MLLHMTHEFFVVLQLIVAWPLIESRCASDLEDLAQLVAVVLSLEQWRAANDLREDAAH